MQILNEQLQPVGGCPAGETWFSSPLVSQDVDEKQVNEILQRFFEDSTTLRRLLVDKEKAATL